jgi:CRISPR-associated protein Csy2
MNQDDYTHLVVLPHLKVHNANAISSPLTHGFPSITAFLGLMWALERKTRAAGLDLAFNAVGVVCHDFDEQTTDGGFVKTFRLTRNPVGRDGGTAAIVEEGRIHLDLSLVLAVCTESWDQDAQRRDLQTLGELLQGMRIAGGSLLPSAGTQTSRRRPWVADFTSADSDDRANEFRKLCARLLPGMALVARDDLIDQRLHTLQAGNPEASRLDAWLSLSRINWRHNAAAGKDEDAWQHDRKGTGWIVPIPVGYGALGELHAAGSVPNTRDTSTPFRFVESLYSMGEWIGPHRLRLPRDLLWYADSRPDDGLYRCRNDYRAPETTL